MARKPTEKWPKTNGQQNMRTLGEERFLASMAHPPPTQNVEKCGSSPFNFPTPFDCPPPPLTTAPAQLHVPPRWVLRRGRPRRPRAADRPEPQPGVFFSLGPPGGLGGRGGVVPAEPPPGSPRGGGYFSAPSPNFF